MGSKLRAHVALAAARAAEPRLVAVPVPRLRHAR